jgi:hypothetical protein
MQFRFVAVILTCAMLYSQITYYLPFCCVVYGSGSSSVQMNRERPDSDQKLLETKG